MHLPLTISCLFIHFLSQRYRLYYCFSADDSDVEIIHVEHTAEAVSNAGEEEVTYLLKSFTQIFLVLCSGERNVLIIPKRPTLLRVIPGQVLRDHYSRVSSEMSKVCMATTWKLQFLSFLAKVRPAASFLRFRKVSQFVLYLDFILQKI